ncbi:YjbF family lipoprotein [Alteromonas lipolytica]|uniref:YjbF family lipoprotein n=1 Tax=Alteromonas lipolytica TaxID=1856405 RepID=A0A1E8FHJ6_9ALTE|nr:YjbF family lipoprotein [Alteromonas lipolytica]OFI35401.1 hypothetical protein BFC17_11555 [Alteromonas lipolytica]GGF76001.1 hypothetical protein GCM10011338_30130 [Alteromonas lipolytica]
MFSAFSRRIILVGLLTGLLLSGCSSTNQLYWNTLKLAFFPDTPSLTLEQVKSSKIDLLKVVHGERQPAFLALAYIEGGHHKWVSADHAVLTMDNNKIIRTSGLQTNLQYTQGTDANPLRKEHSLNGQSWQYQIDIEDKVYGLPVTSQWQEGQPETVTFYEQPLSVIPVTEVMTTEIQDPYWQHTERWENYYWLDASTREVVYSEQQATPYSERMVMTYVSRIARLLNESESDL